jgi:anti-sigma B factor antagonist
MATRIPWPAKNRSVVASTPPCEQVSVNPPPTALGVSPVTKPDDLSIDLRATDGQAVVRLEGELDVYTAPRLRERLAEIISDGHCHIVIDLADLEFIDSTGIGVLVGALKRAQQHGGEIALRSPRRGTGKALEITGLNTVFAIS